MLGKDLGSAAVSTRVFAWLAGLAGLSLVVLVCVQAIRHDERDALVALALVGAALLVIPLLYERLESVKVSATAVEPP